MKNPFYRNILFIRHEAEAYFNRLGYELLAFEGAQASLVYGGLAWFQVIRPERPEFIYTIKLRKQGDSLKWMYERIINPEVANHINVKQV